MGRRTMPDLKETLIQKVSEHMGNDLREKVDYEFNKTHQKFVFSNGSELISRSWDDKHFTKFRSLELSAAAIEELTENDSAYRGFYFELFPRVGRLPHVKENWIISATNPGPPSHWAYKHFIIDQSTTKRVYYSLTTDNKFLPETYVEGLKKTLDPKMAKRMIYGEWIEIAQEVIYYNYSRDTNFKNQEYSFKLDLPIDISFDFNIGEGKPMSAMIGQYVNGKFHAAKTFVVAGARTQDIMDEMEASHLFEMPNSFRVFGDASGSNRDTRGTKTDYDIIMKFLSNYQRVDGSHLDVEKCVTKSNPPIRKRHNLVNGIMRNANDEILCFVYKDAEKLDEGLRLTKLKKGGNYVEDDSDDFQHVTTAFGYWVVYTLNGEGLQSVSIRRG